MRTAALLLALATSARAWAEAPAEAPAAAAKHAVMPFSVGVNMDKDLPKLLDELLLAALSKRAAPGQSFLGSSDITAMLGLEQQQQALGCEDESCMAEVGNALGVDRMVVPAVGKLGDKFAITYKIIDPRQVQVVRRDTLVVTGDESALPAAMDQLAAAILGTAPALEPAAALALQPERMDTGTPGAADAESGLSPLLLAGGGVLALGVLVGAGGGAAVGWADSSLADPASSADTKQAAITGYWVGLGGVGAAVGLLVVGGVLAVLGL